MKVVCLGINHSRLRSKEGRKMDEKTRIEIEKQKEEEFKRKANKLLEQNPNISGAALAALLFSIDNNEKK